MGISLDNVLPPTKKEKKAKHENDGEDDENGESGSESGSGSESESESSSSDESSSYADEPVYQLRERRTNITSYRYNEYDELIKSAIQDEIEAVKGAGNAGKGKDISNIINATEPEVLEPATNEPGEMVKNGEAEDVTAEGMEVTPAVEATPMESEGVKQTQEKYEADTEEDDGAGENGEADKEEVPEEELLDEIPPVVPKYDKKKKKSKSLKVTSLEFTSEEENDDTSDSDFKGTSEEEESEYSLPSESESSDGIRKKRKNYDGPVRRSTRARVARYDKEFSKCFISH